MTFDPTKPVQTRDGRKARIICTDKKSISTIVALVEDENGEEGIISYLGSGTVFINGESPVDLINIEEGEG